MKNSVLMFLVIGVTVFFFGCSEHYSVAPELDPSDQDATSLKSGKKPSANLKGTMELTFNLAGAFDPEIPVWEGTIMLEGYQDAFGLRFFHLSPDKGFSQASPFEETFQIYNLNDPGQVYLAGPDVGVTTLANKPPDPCKYRMNGEIDVANPPFAGWLGRNVHMSGIITWENIGTAEEPIIVPKEAPGILRIN
jgi:hypothetical protein